MPPAQAAELTIAARFSVVGGAAREVPSSDAIAAQRAVHDALARFDETSAQRTLERLLVTFTPTTVTRDVLLPYMHERLPRHAKQLRSFADRWPLALGGPGVSAHLAEQAGAKHLEEDPVTAASIVGL